MTEPTLKKFVVVPRDALDILTQRSAGFNEAKEAAAQACSETGMAHYVIEIRAVATRADRPVKVKNL